MKLTYTSTDKNGKVSRTHETEITKNTYEQTIKMFYGLADLGWKVRKTSNKVTCTLKDADGKAEYVFKK